MMKNGRIFRRKALGLLLAATMLFSGVDVTVLATESNSTIAAEEAGTQDPSQEAPGDAADAEGEKEIGDSADTEQDPSAEDGTGTEGEDQTGDGAGIEDDTEVEDTDLNGETSGNDTEEDKNGNEDDGESSVSENTSSVDETVSENTISISENSLSIKAANSLGNLLLSDLQIAAQDAGKEAAASYAVGEIEVSGTTAKVMLHAAESCTAVVAIYEEGSEKPYAFGSAVVPDGENQVVVEIEADSLPAYFKAKGYLVETDTLRPLSGEYCTVMYTKAMQEFLAKTADDFGDAPVINLDDDKTTNFLVLKDGNLIIKEGAEENEGDEPVNRLVSYDEENSTYTFVNVNDSIKGLGEGDIFIYQYGKHDFYIIKVEKNELQEADGTTAAVIVVSKEELDAAEVFQHVRIDQVSGMDDMSGMDNCPEGVTYLGAEDAVEGYALEGNPSLTIEKKFWELKKELSGDLGYGSGSLSANLKAGFGATITVHYYLGLRLAYADINFEVEASVEGEVKAEGELAIPLVNDSLESTGEDDLFSISYTPKFVVGGEIDGTINLGMSGVLGVKVGAGELEDGSSYGAYNGLKLNILQLDAKADAHLGIKFDPQLKVEEIFNAELKTGVLAGIEASVSKGDSVSSDNSYEMHDCGIQCLSINGYFDVPLDGELKLLKWKEYDLSEILDISAEGSILKFDFAQCYYSIKYKEFDWGECPHRKQSVTVQVKDKYGKKGVSGAAVQIDEPVTYAIETESDEEDGGKTNGAAEKQENLTDDEGVLSMWLPAGKHTLNVTKNGKTTQNKVNVDGDKKLVLHYDYVEEEVYLEEGRTTAIRRKDGSLWMWGYNGYGQIGNGGHSIQRSPFKVMDDVIKVSLSATTSAAVTKDGSLWTWGEYPGNGENAVSTPTKIAENVKSVSLSLESNALIKEDGSLWMWGKNPYGSVSEGMTEIQFTPVKVLDHVKTIEMYERGRLCAAITEDDSLWMWGINPYGVIGNGTSKFQLTPVKVLDHVTKVAYSAYHGSYIAAITEDGSLYMWGSNSYGQLGLGERTMYYTPTKVMEDVKEVFVSDYIPITKALKNDGSLYMWGGTDFDTLSQCVPLKLLDHVISFTGARDAITEDGSLYIWDRPGNGAENAQMKPKKMLDNVKAFFCVEKESSANDFNVGYTFAGITDEGDLYMWKNDAVTPSKVINYVRKGYFNYLNNVVLTENGTLWIWGNNDSGQVGDGSSGYYRSNPVQIIFPDETQSLSESSYSLLTDDINMDEETDEAARMKKMGALQAVHTAEPGSPAVFSGLMPNETYNFYAMKTRETETPLAADNLLYIGQYTSDGGGNLNVPYELRESYETPEIFVVSLTRIDLSVAQITIPDITYTGSRQVVEAVVTYDGQTLAEGVDYEIYGVCLVTEPGEYQVVVKGIGDYCGAVEVTFHVNKDGGGSDPIPGGPDDDPDPDRNDVLPEDVPTNGVIPDGIWIAGISESGYSYTGSAIKPAVRVYDGKILLTEKTDYTISYKNHTNVNDASVEKTAPTITVTGKGNYSGKDTEVFKILPLDIGGEVFGADDMALACNGKAQKPIPELWWDNKKLKNKTDYTVTYYNEAGSRLDAVREAGNYEIELTGVGNFTGVRRIVLHVTTECKLMSKMNVAKIPNQDYLTYIGSPVTPMVTVKDGKTVLTEGTHYTVSYSNNTKIGTGYAIVKGLEAGGYSGTKRVSFKITGVSIAKATISGLSGQTFIYGGTDIMPVLQMSIRSGNEVKTLSADDYSVNWQKNRNAGTATVIVTGNQQKGYTGTVKKTFKIQAFDIAGNEEGRFQAELVEKTASYAKGGCKPVLRVSFKKTDGTVETLREGTDYTLTCTNNKAVNDGSNARKLPTVTIKGKGNFTGTYTQKLTYIITTQDIGNLSINASDKTYQNKKNIYATKVVITDLDGKTLKAGTDYDKIFAYTYKEDTRLDNGTVRKGGETVDKNDIIPAGTVLEVSIAGKGNYTGTLKGTYRIAQAGISSASVTIPAQTYTGRRITPGKDKITVKVKGKKVDSSQYEIVSYQNNVKKGTASVTIRGVENYGGTKTVKFKIIAKGFLWWWR